MSFASGMTVTIRPVGATDIYGDPSTDEPTTRQVCNCAVAPRVRTEPSDRGRVGELLGVDLIAPPLTVIDATDEVEIPDGPYAGVWQVDGPAADWSTSPITGATKGGVIAALVKATG